MSSSSFHYFAFQSWLIIFTARRGGASGDRFAARSNHDITIDTLGIPRELLASSRSSSSNFRFSDRISDTAGRAERPRKGTEGRDGIEKTIFSCIRSIELRQARERRVHWLRSQPRVTDRCSARTGCRDCR